MQTWRLLDMPPMTAAENMALDDVLLELRGDGQGKNTVRFLQFYPRTVLVGFHQSVQEEIHLPYCREHNIEVNRRITGGGAILFDENQIGWEIISEKTFFDAQLPTDALFQRLCEPTITALRYLGIDASFRPRNDIEVSGRKISGTGGTDAGNAFMFQGTLLVDCNVETMLHCLNIPIEKLRAREIESVRQRVTCLVQELGHTLPSEEIKAALSRAFEEHLNIHLERGALTDEEERLFRERLPHFRSQAWIDMVRPEYEQSEAIQEADKTSAGLVRFTLVVNQAKKLLKDIYITGDFFSYPPRALLDLEAALRGKALDGTLLCGIVENFFAAKKIAISGMSAEDLCKPLLRALGRAGATP